MKEKSSVGDRWEVDADGCLVGDPGSKHNACRSRNAHREWKAVIRPDSSCIVVFIMRIPKHTQMLSTAPASFLFAHELPAWGLGASS